MHLLVDGNNVAWAGFHALGRAMGADTPERKTRATLLGLAQTVFGLVVRGGEPPNGRSGQASFASNAVEALVVAFDQGRPLRRRSICPAYQTGREGQSSFAENEPHVTKAIDQFREAAAFMPVTVLQGTNTEADDLIAAYALQSEPDAIRIASTDRDFLQLVDTRISVYAPVKGIVIDADNFEQHAMPKAKDGDIIRFPRERFLDFRALCGDMSDDLPGVPGIGELTAGRLLAFAPLDDLLAKPPLVHEALQRGAKRIENLLAQQDSRDIIERNRQLMDLRLGASHFPDLDPCTARGTFDADRFRAWLDDQRMGRIDTDAIVQALHRLAERQPQA